MILSLLVGIILGAITVVFALQNVAVITVTFMTYQFTAPLAIVLLGTLLSGVIFSVLILMPSLIRDTFALRSLRKEKRALEDEVATYRVTKAVITTNPDGTPVSREVHETHTTTRTIA